MSASEASPATSARSALDPTARPDPLVRGFLFADLRGYTAFVERAGDAAAVDLLSRYRRLVRDVVATHDGAEIRTEGDSFYVVFPSPSAAVRAGMGIVAAASEDAAAQPGDPISVGVGIHAGESAETDEGYVGSAVNLAARICSMAGPGEVLVSDTVRALGRTSLAARFTSRGRRSLKGVAEPVELWAVTPAADALASPAHSPVVASRRARAALIALGAGIVVIAIAAIAAITSDPSRLASASASAPTGMGGPATPSTAAGPSAAPFRTGRLDAGTYRATTFDPPISFDIGPGLSGVLDLPSALVLAMADDPERADLVDSTVGTRLTIFRPMLGVHSCDLALPLLRGPNWDPLDLPGDAIEPLPPDRDALVAWLRADDGIEVDRLDVVRSAGGQALVLDLRINPACRAADTAAKPIVILDEKIAYVMRPREWIRWYITELDGRALVFAVNAREERFDELDRAARSLALSVKRIEGD